MTQIIAHGVTYDTDNLTANSGYGYAVPQVAGDGETYPYLIALMNDLVWECTEAVANASGTLAGYVTDAESARDDAVAAKDDAEDAATLAATYLSSAASTSSVAIGTGTKTFVVVADRQFAVGQDWIAASDAAPSVDYMYGKVTSWNAGTNTVIIDVYLAGGSGTHTDWTLSLTGARGAQGAVTTVIQDADANTKVETERTANDNNIWLRCAGVDQINIINGLITFNPGSLDIDFVVNSDVSTPISMEGSTGLLCLTRVRDKADSIVYRGTVLNTTSDLFVFKAAQPFRLYNAIHSLTTGTCTVAIKKNGSGITGLTALSLSSSQTTTAVGGAGYVDFAAGDYMTVEITSASSAENMSIGLDKAENY